MSVQDAIKAVFRDKGNKFCRKQPGYLAPEDAGTVIRYMGHFISEVELIELMAGELNALTEAGKGIPIEVLERVIIRLMTEQECPPDEEATIIDAFRAIDTEGKGWVDVEQLKEYMTAGHSGFREKEVNEFVDYAKDRDEPNRIYYEDYAHDLTTAVHKHLTKLYIKP